MKTFTNIQGISQHERPVYFSFVLWSAKANVATLAVGASDIFTGWKQQSTFSSCSQVGLVFGKGSSIYLANAFVFEYEK